MMGVFGLKSTQHLPPLTRGKLVVDLKKVPHMPGFSFLDLRTSWCWIERGNKLMRPQRLSGKS